MFSIALALAARLSAPIPTNLQRWATADDVPIRMIPEGPNFTVGFRIVVDPSGKAQQCRIDFSSGINALDSYTCKLVMRRARFRAATDIAGVQTYGVYQSYLAWWIGESDSPPSAPFAGDLDLVVNSLPADATSITARVVFVVDSRGQTSSCAAETQEPMPAPELVDIACNQVAQQLKIVPVKNASGVPVLSVQDAEIRFSTK
jgi:hypothetical protein